MKLKPLFVCMAIAAFLNSISLSQAAEDARKDAATATKSANGALYNQLPFSDKTDFADAHKGFIAALPQEVIKGEAGNVMSRRASYMYGNLLKADAKGQVGAGLGTTTSAGTVTLIAPTDYITKTGEKRTIDGLSYDFMMLHG